MNQPDRYERFVVPQGIQKVTYVPDTKIAQSATIEIQREDHTIGNLVRMQLHEDPAIWFAGYKVPHPLEHRMLVKVRTAANDNPGAAYNRALDSLRSELLTIRQDFQTQVAAQMKDADFEPHKRLQQMDAGHAQGAEGDYGVQYGEDAYGTHYTGDTAYGAAAGEPAYGAAGYADMDTGTAYGAAPGASVPYGAASEAPYGAAGGEYGEEMSYGPAT